MDGDTIVALATAPGRSGIGVLRLSGDKARTIGEAIAGETLLPRQAHFRSFRDSDDILDSGIAIYFPAPASFTGQDVVELQGHGSPVVLDMLLAACTKHGARLARPGEFSERAFLNDRIDLAQAEAIADLINATTQQAALGAMRSLQGDFSKRIDELASSITALRIYVEAAIDFPEEEIDFIGDGQVQSRLSEISRNLEAVFAEARQGTVLQEGMKLVIVGRPNAGKSSLLNALSGQDSAIVTPIEGTTRDVLREHIHIDGMPLHIVDTAGLRDSANAVEQEGIKRAWREIETADHILLVVDGGNPVAAPYQIDLIWPEGQDHVVQDIPVSVIHNKCDLTGRPPGIEERDGMTVINLSAKTGDGLDILHHHLKACVGFNSEAIGSFSARRRHLDALEKAEEFLHAGQRQLGSHGAGELLAEDLRQCQNALGEITGALSADDLLGEIFSSFCIGK
ncbi:MAG: tRNA uridine-5-carboxymethylaminomethyl(34) synthesis GTPase MnmE [Pseudomonadota bacterium]